MTGDRRLHYLSPERVEKLAARADDIKAVVANLPAGATAVDDIDLSMYTGSQRSALEAVVDDLYSVLELRYFVAGQPPPGVGAG